MAEGRSIGKIFVELDLDKDRYMKSQQALLRDATTTSLNIEQNFKNLGIKSSAHMDLMRAKVQNSYEMIANNAKSTANDILRAEEAKNAKLKALNDEQFGRQASSLQTLKSNWLAFSATAVAAIYAIGKAYSSLRDTVKVADDIGMLAGVIGMTTTELQKLQYAYRINDVEQQSFTTGLRMLSRNMDDAAQGTGDAKKYFDAMGISVKDARGNLKPLGQVLSEIADKFASYEDGAQKIAIAMALFGRSGAEMVPGLNAGSKAIRELGENAEKSGRIIKEETIRQAEELDKKFKDLDSSWTAFKTNTLVPIGGTFSQIASSILDAVNALEKWRAKLAERPPIPDWVPGMPTIKNWRDPWGNEPGSGSKKTPPQIIDPAAIEKMMREGLQRAERLKKQFLTDWFEGEEAPEGFEWVRTWEGNLKEWADNFDEYFGKVREILESNTGMPFVKRILNPENYPKLDLGNGQFATHLMGWEKNEQTSNVPIVFPTVAMVNGKLVDLSKEGIDAVQRALNEGDFISFKTEEEADWFSKNYKIFWEKIKPEGELQILPSSETLAKWGREFTSIIEEIDSDFGKTKIADPSALGIPAKGYVVIGGQMFKLDDLIKYKDLEEDLRQQRLSTDSEDNWQYWERVTPGMGPTTEYREAMKKVTEEEKRAKEWGDRINDGLNVMASSVSALEGGWKSFFATMASGFQRLIQDIMFATAKAQIMAMLPTSIGGGGKGFFGLGGGSASSATSAAGGIPAWDAGGAFYFASGGIVTKPTLGVVGESGPEAVIPLDRMKGKGGGGNVYIQNYFGKGAVQATDVKSFERAYGGTVSKMGAERKRKQVSWRQPS